MPPVCRAPSSTARWSAVFRLGIEFVPTLIRMQGGREVARTHGWHRGDWQQISGLPNLGADLPELRPGCASKTLDPGIAEDLQLRFGDTGLTARQVTLGDAEDPMEACYDRGWTDGLPVVPPTARAGAAHAGRHHPRPGRGAGPGATRSGRPAPSRRWPSTR